MREILGGEMDLLEEEDEDEDEDDEELDSVIEGRGATIKLCSS